MNKLRLSAISAALLSAPMFSVQTFAAGTLVSEMSHLNVGTAGAGSAVASDGASTAYSNPAAMGYLKESHFAFNIASMALNITYFDERTQALNSDNAGGVQPYGSLYYVSKLNEKMALGLSFTTTGGSGLDYGNSYAGRLGLNDLQLSVMQLNPSLSYKLNSRWHVGVGLQIDRAVFDQRFLVNQAELESQSYALGYNLGSTYQVNKDNRLGLTYRSKMEHELVGEVIAFNQIHHAEIGLTNAARLELSGSHKIISPIELVWSLGQEYWSENQDTSLQVGDLEGNKQRGFDDVWFTSLGAKIDLTTKFAIEMGLGYVSSPLEDPTQQASDLPVDHQMKYSVGARYRWSRAINLSVYYSYVDYGSPDITSGLMQGSYDNHNQFLGVEVDYQF
ncbi:outer membrane protein transport protein [Vibrio sp. FNV 38]|nr:outer membrane protein transport protein [Vibrio sp. FNV 38]